MHRFFHSDYVRYLVVAFACALLNNAILVLGDRQGFSYFELFGLTFLVTGSLGYLLHSSFTFRRRLDWSQYRQFMVGIALGTPVAMLFVAILRSMIGVPMSVAAPTATILMVIYNFLSARLVIKLLPSRKCARE
jgi:putative flippase GtrA